MMTIDLTWRGHMSHGKRTRECYDLKLQYDDRNYSVFLFYLPQNLLFQMH